MIMVNEPPNVKENGRYTVAQAAALLGVSKSTLYKKIVAGARCGGIACGQRRTVRGLYITGKEILRFWNG